jgi:putative NADPH-quinone reductase
LTKRITIIDGHPDPDDARFCHALANAYAEGAGLAGHSVRRLTLAQIEIPLLRTKHDWETESPPRSIRECQEAIGWAEHLVIIYPLWLGSMPALLKAFLEQAFRPGFAIEAKHGKMWPGLLTRKSARIVITMGMPALAYRWFFLAHSLKSLERNILRFSGIGPIREALIGGVEGLGAAGRDKWLAKARALGRDGQ